MSVSEYKQQLVIIMYMGNAMKMSPLRGGERGREREGERGGERERERERDGRQ